MSDNEVKKLKKDQPATKAWPAEYDTCYWSPDIEDYEWGSKSECSTFACFTVRTSTDLQAVW
jgi:hypothetical protein